MAINEKLLPGERYDFKRETVGSTEDTLSNNHDADLIGNVSAGAGRILITPSGTSTPVKYMDLDFAAGVTDLVYSDVALNAGDSIELVLDSGAVGLLLVRLKSPK